MTSPVRSYELPEGARRLDRATLAAWKAWDAWVRSLLAVSIVMIAVHILVALLSGMVGPEEVSRWRYLVRWGPEPSAIPSVVHLFPEGHFVLLGPSPLAAGAPPTQVLGWSVSWQGAASIAGALAAWRILRRHAHPAALGAAAGLVAVLTHLTAARLFTLAPFGAAAGAFWNALAVFALWSTPLFAAAVGGWIARRRG